MILSPLLFDGTLVKILVLSKCTKLRVAQIQTDKNILLRKVGFEASTK